MEWVRCNLCFNQPSTDLSLFLTNCGHLLCKICAVEVKEKCLVCSQEKCMLLLLAVPLNTEVAMLFTDSAYLLQKQMKEIVKVLQFQNGHRQRFSDHLIQNSKTPLDKDMANKLSDMANKLKDMTDKLECAVNEMGKLDQENQHLRQENAAIKQENAYLKRVLGTRSPASSSTRGTPGSGGVRNSPLTPSPYSEKRSPSNIANAESTPSPRATIAVKRLTLRTPPNDVKSVSPVCYQSGSASLKSQAKSPSAQQSTPLLRNLMKIPSAVAKPAQISAPFSYSKLPKMQNRYSPSGRTGASIPRPSSYLSGSPLGGLSHTAENSSVKQTVSRSPALKPNYQSRLELISSVLGRKKSL